MKGLVLFPAAIVLAAMAQDSPIALQPGQWEFTTAMTEVEMPAAPVETLRAVRSALGPPASESRCVAPEEAANPAASLANPGGGASNCTFSRATFSDGRIDIVGTCVPESQDPIEISLAGTYSATEIRGTINSRVGDGWMLLRGTIAGRRVGDCSPETS